MSGPLASRLPDAPRASPAAARLLSLFEDGGAMAGATFPALLADGAGQILRANPQAGILSAGSAAGLATLIRETFLAGVARHVEVQRVEGSGEAALELSLIPLPEDNLVLVLAADVTLDRNLRKALIESRQRYKALVETASDFVWETAADGTFAFVSPKGALGFDAEALIGRGAAELLFDAAETGFALPFTTRREVKEVELWFQSESGEAVALAVSAQPIFDAEGVWSGARGTCRDVTKARLHQMALARFQNRERLLLFLVRTIRDEVEPDAMLARAATAIARAANANGCRILTLDEAGRFRQGAIEGEAPAFEDEALASQDPHEAAPALFEEVGHGHGLVLATCYRKRRNGAVSLWRKGKPFGEEDKELLAGVADQIGIANEQIAVHQRLLRLSTTDALTGLLNRRAFHEKLDRRFARVAQGRERAALFYLDLDNFKQANDRRGHGAGDAALKKVGEILLQNTRSGDLLARHGGDEFALWLENTNAKAAGEKAAALLEGAAALADFSGGVDAPLGFSIGIAVFDPDHPENLHHLLNRADAAMYRAKRGGKGGYILADAAQEKAE